jgi:hypothetical protein
MRRKSQLFLLPLQEQNAPRAWMVSAWVLVSLYLPFGWLVLFEGPWDQRRLSWIKSWPLLPGLVMQSLEPVASAPPQVSYSLMGAVTLAAFVLLFRLGRKGVTALILAFLLGAGFASFNSWLAFQAYPTAF